MIPLFKVYMAENVEEYLSSVLHSGYIGEGIRSAMFEKVFADFIQNPNVAVVNSGTSAIVMALRLAGIGFGDKVISTPITCLATNTAILEVGATPIWADVLPDGTIDPEDVEAKMFRSDAKAIVCMDWGGTPCKLAELKEISKGYNVPLIEDACQAIGSSYKGVSIGNQSDYVCFSFQAIKHLTTSDGGAIAINVKDKIETAKMMRWFGLDRAKGADMRCNQDPPVAGYKWQLNDIMASIGLANIVGLRDRLAKTKAHADIYNKEFKVLTDSTRQSGYWLYTIFVKDVNRFIAFMKDYEIECSRVHDRNDTKTIFKESSCYLSGVDYFDAYHVCIPVGWWLTDNDVDKIVDLVTKYMESEKCS